MIDNTSVKLFLGSLVLLKTATDTLLGCLMKANIQIEELTGRNQLSCCSFFFPSGKLISIGSLDIHAIILLAFAYRRVEK